jgi:hypothetical protein
MKLFEFFSVKYASSNGILAVFHPKLSGVLVSQVVPELGGKYIGSSGGIGVEFEAGFSSLQEMNRMLTNRLVRWIRLLDILDILDFLDF